MVFARLRIPTLLLALACAAIASLLGASTALAGPVGEIDTSFNSGVAKLVDLAPAGLNLDEARATAVQPDGKILVAGRSANAGPESFVVTRFNTDGSIDTGFGTNGTWSMTFGNAGASTASGIALSGSRIIVGGYGIWGSAGDFVVVQLTPTGQLDTGGSFGGVNGYVTINFGGDDQAKALTVDGTGKILVAGTSGGDGALARLNADGTFDGGFGTGKFTKDFSAGGVDVINDIEVDSTNQVYVAGSKTNGVNTEFLVARFTPLGALDFSFNSSGVWSASIGTTNDVANALTIAPTGKVVAAGTAGNSATPGAEMAIVRLLSDGSPDPTWTSGTNPAGIVTKGFAGSSSELANGVVVDADGHVVVAGITTSVSPQAVAVVRYNDNASLDTAWSGNGDVVTPNPTGAVTINAWGLALSGQRDIVVVGSGTQASELDTMLVRYEGDAAAAGVTTLDLNGCIGSALSFGNIFNSQLVQTGQDCSIQFGNTTSSSMLLVYQSDGTGTAMNGAVSIPDYLSGPADWNTPGGSLFGACLRDMSGGGFGPTWGISPGLTCATDIGQPWHGIPATAGSAGSKVGSALTPGSLVTARLRFGLRTANLQPAGAYSAPLTFEVVSPDA